MRQNYIYIYPKLDYLYIWSLHSRTLLHLLNFINLKFSFFLLLEFYFFFTYRKVKISLSSVRIFLISLLKQMAFCLISFRVTLILLCFICGRVANYPKAFFWLTFFSLILFSLILRHSSISLFASLVHHFPHWLCISCLSSRLSELFCRRWSSVHQSFTLRHLFGSLAAIYGTSFSFYLFTLLLEASDFLSSCRLSWILAIWCFFYCI